MEVQNHGRKNRQSASNNEAKTEKKTASILPCLHCTKPKNLMAIIESIPTNVHCSVAGRLCSFAATLFEFVGPEMAWRFKKNHSIPSTLNKQLPQVSQNPTAA